MKSFILRYKNQIFIILLALLALNVIIPQLSALSDSLAALDTANLKWVLLGLAVYFLSVPFTAMQFMVLALKPLVFYLTVKVETAALFVSRLLPQSVGTISLNAYYLMKARHSAGQTAAILTVDGISSGIAYSTLMIVALLVSPISLKSLEGDVNISVNLLFFAVILLLGAIYIAYRSVSFRQRLITVYKDLKNDFTIYKRKPASVGAAVMFNGLGSLTSVFALYASAAALGVDLSFSSALLAITFGNVAATLIPTPGGIGAVEAGIYSGLVLTGVNGPEATLITLIYRLITYWIPFIPGYIAFWNLRHSLLADYQIKTNNAP